MTAVTGFGTQMVPKQLARRSSVKLRVKQAFAGVDGIIGYVEVKS